MNVWIVKVYLLFNFQDSRIELLGFLGCSVCRFHVSCNINTPSGSSDTKFPYVSWSLGYHYDIMVPARWTFRITKVKFTNSARIGVLLMSCLRFFYFWWNAESSFLIYDNLDLLIKSKSKEKTEKDISKTLYY